MRCKVGRSFFQSVITCLAYASVELGNLLTRNLSDIMKQWSDVPVATQAPRLFHHDLPKSSWG